jgi:hypothetical protein
MPSETIACHFTSGLSARCRLAVLAHLLGQLGDRLHHRIAIREDLERQLGELGILQPLGGLVCHARP